MAPSAPSPSAAKAKMKTIYVGRFIDAPTAAGLRIRAGAVLVSAQDGTGVIEKADWTVRTADEAVGKFELGREEVNVQVVTAGEDGFFFPGFIDTHIHASQYPNSGIFGTSTLLDWLTTYTFPMESSLGNVDSPMYTSTSTTATKQPDPLARATKTYTRLLTRTLSHGTTTASYFATVSVPATNLLATLALQRGQRALIGRVCMDNPLTCPDYYRDESPQQSLENARASIAFCRQIDPTGDMVAPIVTPRFAPSCMAETLVGLGKIAREDGVRVQTHVSENVGECALVKELFPDRRDYVDVYDHAGLLGEKTILAHAVHLSDEEVAVVRERGSKIAHCPASNSALGSGFCRVRKLLDAGVEVGLGTDVSGGWHVSVLDAVRQAVLVSRHVGFVEGGDARLNVGVPEALWLATVGGAKVVGLEGRVGVFEEGCWWDVQEIALGGDVGEGVEAGDEGDGLGGGAGAVDVFGWESWDDRVAKWVWTGDDRNVKRVWVGGRLVHALKK